MQPLSNEMSRRDFFASTTGAAVSGLYAAANAADPTPAHFRARPPKPSKNGRKPIAAICTAYFTMSHAYHIAGRFIQGYTKQGRFHVPKQYVSALYVEQVAANDVSRQIAREYDVRIAPTIADALTNGSSKLAVDGVLLIGEHGNYPVNAKAQTLYPRYELMEQIVSVFRQTGRSVPVFNDKHLSYSWAKAKKMVEWSKELKFPFMAGSSLPVTWRRPELELPLGVDIEDALVAAYSGLDIYGFHALETLQVMVERRKGGETGVKAVTCLSGDAVWKAGDAGRWSWNLLEAALGRSETINPGDIRRNVGPFGQGGAGIPPAAFLIEYRDGLRTAVLMLTGHHHDFCFAAKLRGDLKTTSCLFHLPPPPGAKYFDCLVANIEKMFNTGQSPYPVERTLLTSGVLDFALESNYRRGIRIETPELGIRYEPPADSGFCRGDVAAPV